MHKLLTVLLVTAVSSLGAPVTAHASEGTWLWPVTGPVTRPFDPPDSPYGSGHRGIDIAVPYGTIVIAPASGTVVFAAPVGGCLFLTIDHGGGLESTYSWVSGLSVRTGAAVVAGQPIALSGNGHPGDTLPSLHFGVKLNDVYVDPMLYLESENLSSFIRLAPLPAGVP